MTEPNGSDDILLQQTCQEIVDAVAKAIDADPPNLAVTLQLPDGPAVGKQITIDASEKKDVLNMCRLAILNADIAPASEVVRIEYEHDKQTKFGMQRVYSIQSIRKKRGELVLMENFLAETPKDVREEDFRSIKSEQYAQDTVLSTLKEWTHYRAWQLQEARKSKP